MKFSNEAKIGVMVVSVLGLLAYLTIKTGNFSFKKEGYEIKVHFYNIDGVDDNAPVRLNGMEIGLVKDMEILYGDDTRMELTLRIDAGVKIHEGSQAYVKNLGLFGEKYIGLTIGDTKKPFMTAGSIIIGEEAANFEKMMADGEQIAQNIKEISEEVNERLKVNSESIDEIISNLRITSNHIVSISQNLDEHLIRNKGHIDEIIANLDSATQNFDEMSYDLKLNPWKLMYKQRAKKDKNSKKSTRDK